MGIPGLISVIGPGERVSLSKFAVHFLQDKKRPIRVAIDISIWLFQIQASKGGLNPELRTLLFRLVRLTSLPIHPLFVYDGKDRPRLKRGKVVRGSNGSNASILERQSQKLLTAFNLPWHRAPGEAEAECALLQRVGIVDAVMTEDIDAVMFGSEVTLLNFSKEVGSSNAATHVSVYRTRRSNLGQPPNVEMDRQAMILFALLSGGDYIPAGVPKCGTKLAGEIVAAGFGKRLMAIFRSDGGDQEARLAEWRKQLEDELHTNSSSYFKTKHKAIKIPDTFPDKQALLAYAIPVVSSAAEFRALKQSISWCLAIDPEKVRNFAEEVLGWETTSGALTLTNLLGPPLLMQRMLLQLPLLALFNEDEDTNAPIVCSEKKSSDQDGYDEIRVEFLPIKVVGFTIDDQAIAEATGKHAGNVDVNYEVYDAIDAEIPQSPTIAQPSRTSSSFNTKQPKRIWVPEPVAVLGMADTINEHRLMQAKKREAQRKAAEEKARRSEARKAKQNAKRVVDPSMKEGSILKYTRVIKSGTIVGHKPSPKKHAASPAEKQNGTLSSQFASFSGSDVFDSSQTLPPSQLPVPLKNTKGSENTTAQIEGAQSENYGGEPQDNPHTSDFEAAFESDYHYEGSGPSASGFAEKSDSKSLDNYEDCTQITMSSKRRAQIEEDIVQSMQKLTVSIRPKGSETHDDVIERFQDLSISHPKAPVQRSSAGRHRHTPPRASFNSKSPGRRRDTPGYISFGTSEGAHVEINEAEVAHRNRTQRTVIPNISDSGDLDKQPLSDAVTTPHDTGSTVRVLKSQTATSPEQEHWPSERRVSEKPRKPAGQPESKSGTGLSYSKLDPPVQTDENLMIETYNGFWRYRLANKVKAGASDEPRKAKHDDMQHCQPERKFWQGGVECIDMT
ncbi:hypothetical protein KEM54_005232 [Ascosphaera aggregata]|nr:hypothetical protein KEM54_005232 [Ascosphaera aggregata]